MPTGVARYNESKHTWRFENGSILELAFLDNYASVLLYQGAEYGLVIFEELTQFTEAMYVYMLSRLRVAGKVKARMEQLGWPTRVMSTSNPGGPGHGFVKARFIDPGIRGRVWQPEATEADEDPGTRCYIPARVDDNPHIDAGYIRQLNRQEPVMRRALRDGDWDILEGVRFSQFRRALHVVEPEQLPLPIIGIPRGVGVDYGHVDPWCALWGAVLPDQGFGRRMVVYRELYGPGFTAQQQATMIKDAEVEGERTPTRPIPMVLDPQMWSRTSEQLIKGGKGAPAGSVAWYYENEFGSQVSQAQNERIAGWSLIDELLRIRGDGLPGLLIYSTCTNLIRELPSQQRSKKNPEDLVATGPGHADASDALRYLAMLLIRGGHDRTSNELPRAAVSTITGSLTGTQF